jgi:hypothetical protein
MNQSNRAVLFNHDAHLLSYPCTNFCFAYHEFLHSVMTCVSLKYVVLSLFFILSLLISLIIFHIFLLPYLLIILFSFFLTPLFSYFFIFLLPQPIFLISVDTQIPTLLADMHPAAVVGDMVIIMQNKQMEVASELSCYPRESSGRPLTGLNIKI